MRLCSLIVAALLISGGHALAVDPPRKAPPVTIDDRLDKLEREIAQQRADLLALKKECHAAKAPPAVTGQYTPGRIVRCSDGNYYKADATGHLKWCDECNGRPDDRVTGGGQCPCGTHSKYRCADGSCPANGGTGGCACVGSFSAGGDCASGACGSYSAPSAYGYGAYGGGGCASGTCGATSGGFSAGGACASGSCGSAGGRQAVLRIFGGPGLFHRCR